MVHFNFNFTSLAISIQNNLVRTFIKGKEKTYPVTYYELQQEFVDIWNDELGYKGLKESIDTKQAFTERIQTRNELINNMFFKSFYFDNSITKYIYGRYMCHEKFIRLINIFEEPRVLFNYAKGIAKKLQEIYIEYLVGFEDFYKNYPGFDYVFSFYFAEQMDKPFYEHYDKDCKVLTYNKSDFKFLYLKLVKNIFDANFISKPPEKDKRNIIDALLEIESSGTKREVKLAKQTRYKIHRYKGVKFPEWFVFGSNIKNRRSALLAKYVKKRFVDSSVNYGSLKAFFKGRLSIVEETIANEYKHTELVSGPIKIKSKKIGYITFILNHLFINEYIGCNKLWKKISYHKYFVDHNGKEINPNQFARAFSDKFQNLNTKINENDYIDPALQDLNEFLNNIFPKRINA